MNVLNRKMFANRDARRKLANMGGIIASSDTLLGAAQKFAPGGQAQVEEYLVVIPGITEGPVKLNANTLSRLQESAPEAMANATILDRDSAAQQGFELGRLRPADLFIERRMMEAIRPTIEAPTVNVDEIVAREARITDDARQFAQDRRSFPQPLDRIVDPTGPVGIFSGKTPSEKFMGPGIISGKTPGEKLAGVTSLFRSEPEPVSEPDLVSTTRGRGDDDMRVGFNPNRTITESLALSRGAADAVGPGSTTQDMALSQIMDRAENLTGKDKAVASLEALIATNQPGLDVDTSMSGALLPGIPGASNVAADTTGIGSIAAAGNEQAIRDTLPGVIRDNELLRSRGTASVGAANDLGIAGLDDSSEISDPALRSMDALIDRTSRYAGPENALEIDRGTPDPSIGTASPSVTTDEVFGFNIGDILTRPGVVSGKTPVEKIVGDDETPTDTTFINPLTGEETNIDTGVPAPKKTKAQETAEQAAETNEQAQAAVSDRADVDPPLPAEKPLNAGDLVPGANDPDANPAERSKNTATQVLSGLGVKGAGDMSTKERVKAYQDMFKEFLGEDDADANEEKWHNLAMIGFAIAAGEDPNALSNIASGLLQGSKLMQSQRAQKREREDKLTSMAIEQVLSEDSAAQKFERDLALIRARGTGTGSNFEKMPTRTEAILDYITAMKDTPAMMGLTPEEQLEKAAQIVDASGYGTNSAGSQSQDQGSSGSVYKVGQTATNKAGDKIVWDGTSWQPVKK